MEDDIFVKYDSLCYATMVNVKTMTSGAERIVLHNFNWKDDEHKFVVAIINACYHILGSRKIAVDADLFSRRAMARKFTCLGKVEKPKKDEEVFVDVPELLEFMRPTAISLFDEDFSFANIYKAYYDKEKENDI